MTPLTLHLTVCLCLAPFGSFAQPLPLDSAGESLLQARLLIDSGHYHLAISKLDSALNSQRQQPQLWFYKGLAHSKVSELETALKCFGRAIKYDRENVEFHLNKGVTEFRLSRYPQAHESFVVSLRLAEQQANHLQQAQALYWLGMSSQTGQEFELAKRFYRQALALDAQLNLAALQLTNLEIDALYAEAKLALQAEKLPVARTLFQDIFDRDPGYKDVAEILLLIPEKTENKKSVSGDSILNLAGDSDEKEVGIQVLLPRTLPVEADTTSESPHKPLLDTLTELPASTDNSRKEEDDHAAFWPTVWSALAGTLLFLAILYFFYHGMARKMRSSQQKFSATESAYATISLPDFKKYEIQDEIGRGTMGIVYRARDLKLDRTVALKVIRFENVLDAQDRKERIERFHREARATAVLNHPNIVGLYDYDEAAGLFYMTMEYVDGASLNKVLEQETRVGVKRAVPIIRQVLRALDYAHQRHIIHRDIKPSNIMLCEGDVAKILDFGLAKLLNTNKNPAFTDPGIRVGSPQYMSPEQINAAPVDARSDIFSLGVVFYEMLTGRRPFRANADENLAQLFYEVLNSSPPKVSDLRSEVPPELGAVVAKMLAKDPGTRFQNVAEVLAALCNGEKRIYLT